MVIDETETTQATLTYSITTHSVQVSATPEFLGHEKTMDTERYVWVYHIHIENLGQKKIQLLNRHWIIIDGNGQIQEVKGPGVVGARPTLEPTEGFEYSSGTFLSTPTGMMMGKYEMVTEDGELMEIDIPAFSLDSPEGNLRVN
jgi:ApaG protein